MSAPSPSPPNNAADDCSICLNALTPGVTLLTLACNHKFHLQCLASNVKAHNNECPLCRNALDTSLVQMLASAAVSNPSANLQPPTVPVAVTPPVPVIVRCHATDRTHDTFIVESI